MVYVQIFTDRSLQKYNKQFMIHSVRFQFLLISEHLISISLIQHATSASIPACSVLYYKSNIKHLTIP